MKQMIAALACTAALALQLAAQQSRPMTAKETGELSARMIQLMESVAVVIPDLQRTAGPLVDPVNEAKQAMDRAPGTLPATFAFLEQARKYNAVAQAVPRPYPFPEVAQRQLAELREGISRFEEHFRALLVQREAQLRPADRDNLRRYAEANMSIAAPSPANPRVVFVGDSITDGWRLNEYFPGKDYVNRGISGQVTSEMLARMKADVLDLKPQAMLILAGTNDIARGTPLTAIQNNLTMICDLASAQKVKVILASVLPIHDYNASVNPSFRRTGQRPMESIRSLNAWIQSFAANRGYLYLNYFDSLKDSAGFLQKDLAEDGLHPNAAGYRVMAPLAQDAILKAVTPAPAGRKK